MSERDGYQTGVPCWIDTWQPDADAAVSFYTQLFGWEAEDTMPAGVEGKHYMCRVRGRDVAAVASRPEEATPVTAWNTYVWVDEAERTAEQAVAAGGSLLKEPFEALDGGRIAVIADPADAALGVWQPGAHKGAQLVNEPGAWSMSALETSDAERAKAFYGEVFGWESEPFGPPEAGITLWRLPGYVGGTPQQPVPRDNVAVMAPGGDGPARWSVDFWVFSADQAAAKATELGGRAVTQPDDVPGVPGMRQAVLADPAGAVFSITQPPGLSNRS
jgi:predicted enzyme related to lactoylglutathione lyase